jgi:hypothetical protein
MYNDIYTYTVLVSYISLRVIYILQDIILDNYIYIIFKNKKRRRRTVVGLSQMPDSALA